MSNALKYLQVYEELKKMKQLRENSLTTPSSTSSPNTGRPNLGGNSIGPVGMPRAAITGILTGSTIQNYNTVSPVANASAIGAQRAVSTKTKKDNASVIKQKEDELAFWEKQKLNLYEDPGVFQSTLAPFTGRGEVDDRGNEVKHSEAYKKLVAGDDEKLISTLSAEYDDKIKALRKELAELDPEKYGEAYSKWDFFQTPEAFKEGSNVFDVIKTILGTTADAGLGLIQGAASMVEGVMDLGVHAIGWGADLLGEGADAIGLDSADKWLSNKADALHQAASVNAVANAFASPNDFLDGYSVFGRTTDTITHGLGQALAIYYTGGLLGAAGMASKAASALTYGVMGASSMGSGISEAYASGATDGEAFTYGLIAGAADVATEMLFGEMGKGMNMIGFNKGALDIDDLFAKKVAKVFTNQAWKNVAEFGVKSAAGGVEEWLAGVISALGKKATYLSEKEWEEIIADENLLEQFIVGAFTSGTMQGKSLYNANKTGTDLVTGFTQSEQKVIDREVEKLIAEMEKNGTKLSSKEKAEIQEQVESGLDKGYISIDTIEEVFGGDGYKSFTETSAKLDALQSEYDELYKMKNGDKSDEQIDRQAELKKQLDDLKQDFNRDQAKLQLSDQVYDLVKESRLAESYNEFARKHQAYTADLSKYDTKQQAVIQKAIDSGVLNNTNRTHEFVDFVAKASADTGTPFDFTNNQKLKESGFSIDGKTVNGFVTKDGITLNIQSAKALNKVVGHEIAHVLEGTDLYDTMQKAVFDYAVTTGEFRKRYDSLKELYKDVKDADIKKELTADLIGDYLFSDADFINNLSTKHRNIAQKIYDEIKHLLKIAAAGSKEARKLEKVKKAFEDAYRATSKAQKNTAQDGGTKYSLMAFVDDGRRYVEIDQEQHRFDGHNLDEFPRIAKDIINEKFNGRVIGIDNKMFVNGAGRDEFSNPSKRIPDDLYDAKMRTSGELDNLLDAGTNFRNKEDGADGHYHKDVIGGFDYFDTLFKIGDRYYEAVINIKNVKKGKLFKDVTKIKDVTQDIMSSYGEKPKSQFLRTSSMDILSNYGKNVKTQYSLSGSDTDKSYLDAVRRGDTESAQVMVDSVAKEAGYAIEGYHGTDSDFWTFSLENRGRNGEMLGVGYYFTADKNKAELYSPKTGTVKHVYLDIKKPISHELMTISQKEWGQFLDFAEQNKDKYIDGMWKGNRINKELELRDMLYFDNDADFIKSFIDTTAGRNATVAEGYLKMLRDSIGYDGLLYENGDAKVYVAFTPEQIKSADPVTYDDNGNVIPLSERFNAEEKDIRKSLSNVGETQKSTGKYNVYGKDIALPSALSEDIGPVAEESSVSQATVSKTENIAPVAEMFPDNLAPIDQEIDNLAQQFVELEGKLFDMADAGQFGDEFNRLSEEWSDVKNRLEALEQEAANEDAYRLDSLDDTEAPPDIGPVYDEFSDATPITKKLEADIARDVRMALALRNKNMADVHAIIQRYSNNEITGRNQLFNELKNKFGTYTDRFGDDTVAEAKKYLRTYGLQVADYIQRDIADFAALKKQNRYKIKFSDTGTPVDMLYAELNGMYPNLFPDSIDVPTDQFMQMIEVANMDNVSEYSQEISDESIMEVADTIIRYVGEYRLAQREKAANRNSRIAFDSLVKNADQYMPQFSQESYRRLSERPNVIDPDAIGPMPETYTSKSGDAKGQLAFLPEQARAESNSVAKILPSRKHERRKGVSNVQWVKEHIFSHGSVFETLSLKTGNRELQARFDAIRRASGIAQNLIANGDPKNGVPSLKAIVDATKRSGLREEFKEYLAHKLNVDRMTLEERFGKPNAPVFGETVTADTSRQRIAEMEKKYKGFDRAARDIYRITDHLRNKLVEAGFISQETADRMHEMYPHYIPIVREGFEGNTSSHPYAGVISPIKSVEGGSNNIEDLLDTLGSRIVQTYKAVAKNRFGAELKNTLGTTIENEAEVTMRNEVANRIAEAEKYGAKMTAKQRAEIQAQVAVDLKNGYLDTDSSMDDVLENVDQHEKLLQEGQNGRLPTYTVFENGKRVKFEISEEMYEAMKPRQFNRTIKPLNMIGNARRAILTTYSPTFMLTNPIKDIGDIIVNSQHPIRTYFSIPSAIKEIVTKGKYYQERMAHGGDQDSYFDAETQTFKKEPGKIAKFVGWPFKKIQNANEVIEQIPRMAEYIASRNMGRSIDVAMLDSARVTTNFGAPGDLTNMLNRNGFTFLSASVEGLNQQVRNVREAKAEGAKGWLKLATKYAISGLPAILLNSLLWDDDDEYEELSDYVKENYYIVYKYGDGKFVRIPKGRAVAVIQNAFEQVYNASTGDDEVDFGRFTNLFFSNLAPNDPLENNVLSPINDIIANESWYGENLVPQSLQDLPAAEQYDESTDLLSRWIGEVADGMGLDISPVKVNYLLDQYTGGIGDIILPHLTPESDGGGLGAALRDKFTTDSTMKNQNVSDFYDTIDKLTTKAKSSKATDEDVLSYKYMMSVNSDLSDLYQEKRDIQNSNMSDTEKSAAIRDIQKEIVSITKDALASYGNISYEDDYREGGIYARVDDRVFKWYEPDEDSDEEPGWRILSGEQLEKYETTKAVGTANYASNGSNHYRWYVPGEDSESKPGWRKISDEELAKQKKVTMRLRITPNVYWSNKDEYDFAYEYPEKYAVSQAVGGYDSYRMYTKKLYNIKADKDSDGKSISGSRKKKVIEYINNMDADYGAKIILFKSEYPADDTYNYEIIDYLNSRDDISYEEMATILIELGFRVDTQGNISW